MTIKDVVFLQLCEKTQRRVFGPHGVKANS